ncbi:MAG: HAD-IA family hydrolase [Gemmatimonadetes bacterium]|nr:HAD-IA family hydrolase [Gemmatimonadota bacterium]NIO31028.1 HAD-IA family hydrolase [Gemmatimonadota bacterium]
MTARYRGILFDLDGTLVDSLDLILASYRHTMKTHLGRVPPDDEWKNTMGTPLRAQLQSFASSPEQAESMFRTYIEHNEANHERLIRTFPGMREAAVALRRAGYRLAVVTSKLGANAERELRTCGLDGLFDGLVSASDVRRPKPDPEPVVMGLQSIELPAEDALLVGDSLYDLQAGRAAGVDTAAALWGPFDRQHLAAGQPDHWLETIDQLLVLLNAEPWKGNGG